MKRKFKGFVVSLSLGMMAICPSSNAATTAVPGEYIVKAKSAESLQNMMSLLHGGISKITEISADSRLYLLQGVKPEALPASSIEYVEPNYLIQIEPVGLGGLRAFGADPFLSQQWSFAKIGLPEIWKLNLATRSEVKVAVIDTGVSWDHLDLAAQIYTHPGEAGLLANNGVDDDGNGYVDDVHGWNAAGGNADSRDVHGHGTHCAGVIGAVTGNGVGVAGIASNVKIVPVRFINSNGFGSSASAIQAIEYARKLKVQIMSNSWGSGASSRALEDAVRRAEADGILFIAAAGNESADNDRVATYPANYKLSNVISVAATDPQDMLVRKWPSNPLTGSNYGATSVHLGAPGYRILSTIPGNRYEEESGTSMAAPHVSGVAALLLSIRPELKPEQVRNLLVQSSAQTTDLRGKVISGGRLDAFGAVKRLMR